MKKTYIPPQDFKIFGSLVFFDFGVSLGYNVLTINCKKDMDDQKQVECKKHGKMPAYIYSVDKVPLVVVCFMCWVEKESKGMKNHVDEFNSSREKDMSFEEAKEEEVVEEAAAPAAEEVVAAAEEVAAEEAAPEAPAAE